MAAGDRTPALRVSTGGQSVEVFEATRGGTGMQVQSVYDLPVEGAVATHNPKGANRDTPYSATTTSGTLLDAAAKRIVAWATNEGAAKVHLSFDGSPATAGCHPLYPGQTVAIKFAGEVRVRASSGTCPIHVTEWRLP